LFENVDISIFLYFENFIFLGIFELLKNRCHMTRSARQTPKIEREKYFRYF